MQSISPTVRFGALVYDEAKLKSRLTAKQAHELSMSVHKLETRESMGEGQPDESVISLLEKKGYHLKLEINPLLRGSKHLVVSLLNGSLKTVDSQNALIGHKNKNEEGVVTRALYYGVIAMVNRAAIQTRLSFERIGHLWAQENSL